MDTHFNTFSSVTNAIYTSTGIVWSPEECIDDYLERVWAIFSESITRFTPNDAKLVSNTYLATVTALKTPLCSHFLLEDCYRVMRLCRHAGVHEQSCISADVAGTYLESENLIELYDDTEDLINFACRSIIQKYITTHSRWNCEAIELVCGLLPDEPILKLLGQAIGQHVSAQNPTLCRQLTQPLVILSQKYRKVASEPVITALLEEIRNGNPEAKKYAQIAYKLADEASLEEDLKIIKEYQDALIVKDEAPLVAPLGR